MKIAQRVIREKAVRFYLTKGRLSPNYVDWIKGSDDAEGIDGDVIELAEMLEALVTEASKPDELAEVRLDQIRCILGGCPLVVDHDPRWSPLLGKVGALMDERTALIEQLHVTRGLLKDLRDAALGPLLNLDDKRRAGGLEPPSPAFDAALALVGVLVAQIAEMGQILKSGRTHPWAPRDRRVLLGEIARALRLACPEDPSDELLDGLRLVEIIEKMSSKSKPEDGSS